MTDKGSMEMDNGMTREVSMLNQFTHLIIYVFYMLQIYMYIKYN